MAEKKRYTRFLASTIAAALALADARAEARSRAEAAEEAGEAAGLSRSSPSAPNRSGSEARAGWGSCSTASAGS